MQTGPSLLFIFYICFCAAILVKSKPWSLEHLAGTASAEDLGWVRSVVCVISLIYVCSEDTTSLAWMPAELRSPQSGAMGFLYALPLGLENLARSLIGLWLFKAGTCVSLLCAALGFKSRWTLPISTLGVFVLGGIHREYTHFFHTGLIPLYLLMVLNVLPCADGFSLDGRLDARKDRGGQSQTPSYLYGYARYAVWAVIALSYFSSGMSKLRAGGFDWWNAGNLKSYIFADSLTLIEYDFNLPLRLVNLPDWVYGIFGIAGFYGELSVILILFSRSMRFIMPGFLFVLHLGIFLMQEFVFWDALMLPFVFMDYRIVSRVLTSYKMIQRGGLDAVAQRR